MVHFNKVLGTKNVRRLIVCNYISIAALHSVKLVTEDDEDFVSRQMEGERERERKTRRVQHASLVLVLVMI